MLDKKKHHFLQLVVIFGAITLLTLLFAWGSREGTTSSMGMMGQSMGSMMQSMHAKNVTISDLIKQQEQTEMSSGMSSHHESGSMSIKISHYLTTGIIIVLLPFIIAGAVFLGIVWWK